MMNKRGVLIALFLCLAIVTARADVFDEVAIAIRTGNAKEAAKYFDANVELKTGNKSGNYSRNQAEMVLKDFFASSEAPRTFNIIHKGSSAQGAQYAIGTLETPTGTYRVYIYLKIADGKSFIQEMSFEKK